MRFLITMCAATVAVAAPSHAIEPRAISAARQVKADHGAVRLSVQSQVQQGATIHLWFLREGGDPSRSADVLKFERKQGVPLLGTNTVDSRPLVYSILPGRYRLLGYGVGCGAVPTAGTYGCISRMNGIPLGTMPARGYDEPELPAFEVVAGRLTDAGEFILEASGDAPISEEEAFKHLQRNHRDFQIRVRPFLAAQPGSFAALGAGPPVTVPKNFESRIICRARPEGAMMYLPFNC